MQIEAAGPKVSHGFLPSMLFSALRTERGLTAAARPLPGVAARTIRRTCVIPRREALPGASARAVRQSCVIRRGACLELAVHAVRRSCRRTEPLATARHGSVRCWRPSTFASPF